MKKITQLVKTHKYTIAVAVLILLTLLLRFYAYPMRWGLAYDQAHDVIVARYALEHGKIPLLGPFSSAGPFQTGGEWYWFIMLGMLIFPFWIQGPWILLTLMQALFVLVMIQIGKELINKKAALVIGLLAAFSPAEISQSTNLTNQGPISLLSAMAILAMIFFVKKRSYLSIFLLGFFVSLATSIHMEGAALFILIILTGVIARPSIKHILLLLCGIAIPCIPILLAEYQYGFFNTKGFLQYYLHDQYKIPLEMLGRRWTTYIGVIWPNTIASAVGGIKPLGYFVIALWILTVPFFFMSVKLTKYWIILLASFIFFIVGLRYVHTPLFDSYFMFAHPFMFILTGTALYALFRDKKSRVVALLFLLIILAGNSLQIKDIIKKSDTATNTTAALLNTYVTKHYPNQTVSVFDYRYKNTGMSFPLVMYLQYNHKVETSGHKIAFGKSDSLGNPLADLESSTSAQLKKSGWIRITPQDVYGATEDWYKNKKKI